MLGQTRPQCIQKVTLYQYFQSSIVHELDRQAAQHPVSDDTEDAQSNNKPQIFTPARARNFLSDCIPFMDIAVHTAFTAFFASPPRIPHCHSKHIFQFALIDIVRNRFDPAALACVICQHLINFLFIIDGVFDRPIALVHQFFTSGR